MAAKFESELGASTNLIEGGGGIFDVRIDDKLIYSKTGNEGLPATGEFPDEAVLISEVAATS